MYNYYINEKKIKENNEKQKIEEKEKLIESRRRSILNYLTIFKYRKYDKISK